MNSKNDTTYQLVTDRIIAKLKTGTIPWAHYARTPLSLPKNLVTKKSYRGINVFLLSGTKFTSPWWLTYKQACSLGGNVSKGEKAHLVVFWKPWVIKEKDGEPPKTIFLLKHWSVFNVEQCEGIGCPSTPEQTPRDTEPVDAAETIVNAMPDPPKLIIDRVPRAYYVPSQDIVHVPERALCVSSPDYYDALFHELVHATGHQKRLNRAEFLSPRSSPAYATEELVAEMGSAMLCAEAGMFQEVLENVAAYIAGWLDRLGADNRLVVHSASKGQKAADWIMDRKYVEPVIAAGSQETGEVVIDHKEMEVAQ